MNVLELHGVEKRYRGRGGDVVACSGIDLNVAENEFVALIGPSGCGKSTVLSLVAGLLAPTSGSVLLDGKPIAGPGPDRGVVFQQYALLPWMTVRENLRFAVESVRGTTDAAANTSDVDDVLATRRHDRARHRRALRATAPPRRGDGRSALRASRRPIARTSHARTRSRPQRIGFLFYTSIR